MPAQNVEARGRDAALQLYELHAERNDSPFFSVYYGRDQRFYFSDNDPAEARAYFEKVLDVLDASESTAIYTIKFHDELNKRRKIDNNTPVVGSFNFRMYDSLGPAGPERYRSNVQQVQPAANPGTMLMNKLQERMMEKMLAQLDAGDAAINGAGEYDKEQFIMDIVNSPVGEGIIGLIRDILPIKRRTMQQQPGASMAGVHDDEKLMANIELLRDRDPHFDEHLAMLAQLIQESPNMYKRAINKLKDALS